MANLEQIRDAIRVRLGVPAVDTFYGDETLDDLANESLQVVSVEEDWPWLQATETITTVNGTQAYSPTDPLWMRTKALVISGYDAMQWHSLQEIREFGADYVGLPTQYTLFGDQILFGPTPDGAYSVTHDYLKQESPLVDATDEPLMPSQFHGAVIAFATHLAFLRAGDQTRASAYMQEYREWLNRMRDHRRRTSSPLRVRVRRGGGL